MPQLDFSTYASQVFWLVVTFSVLFLLVWRV
ncbi:MAG: F0F1 ATP synthase subunit B', partial [Rhodospirillales bacterium]